MRGYYRGTTFTSNLVDDICMPAANVAVRPHSLRNSSEIAQFRSCALNLEEFYKRLRWPEVSEEQVRETQVNESY